MLKQFQNHINANLSFLNESKLLIAISGGLDSMALAHLCKELNLNITLAHCNFKLRGTESDQDANFVTEFAESNDLEVFVEVCNTETYAETEKLSIQMAARELRYNWFFDLAERLNFDYILTAHHADDNLETFLINLSRGTGLNGLTGIPEINDNIIRPLLPFSRVQLEDYIKAKGLNWREDSSNASHKYLRNKLRHEVIPVLKDINPKLLDNFQKTINHLNDSRAIVEDSFNELLKKGVVKLTETGLKIDISIIKQFENPKGYLYLVLNNYGFSEWNDVLNLLDAQSGKQLLSDTHRLIKDRAYLILTSTNQTESESTFLIEDQEKTFEAPFGILEFNTVELASKPTKTTIFIDKDKLVFPLILRQWKDGDVFYPSGMKGKKKLSKFFKDEKLSIVDKENVWLLASKEDIVWVIGMRSDNRFTISDNTSNILKITLR